MRYRMLSMRILLFCACISTGRLISMRSWKSRAFTTGIRWSATVARSPLNALTGFLMRRLGDFTLWVQGGRRQGELTGMAREWQRMFPRKEMVPIVAEDEDTVVAEIHAACPLRGTGDVNACYRMMEYDRYMLKTLGGQLVVLNSQSEPGRSHCRVALRMADASVDDLVAAHER